MFDENAESASIIVDEEDSIVFDEEDSFSEEGTEADQSQNNWNDKERRLDLHSLHY